MPSARDLVVKYFETPEGLQFVEISSSGINGLLLYPDLWATREHASERGRSTDRHKPSLAASPSPLRCILESVSLGMNRVVDETI